MFIKIPLIDSFGNNITLEGYLTIPKYDNNTVHTRRSRLVIFVHGSGSSKDSPRNNYLAQLLNKNNIATFLFDLLTKAEEESDNKIAKIQNQVPGLTLNKFNISLLSDRLIKVTNYILQIPEIKERREVVEEEKVPLNVGYFGARSRSCSCSLCLWENK